jgi:hypothetical protein
MLLLQPSNNFLQHIARNENNNDSTAIQVEVYSMDAYTNHSADAFTMTSNPAGDVFANLNEGSNFYQCFLHAFRNIYHVTMSTIKVMVATTTWDGATIKKVNFMCFYLIFQVRVKSSFKTLGYISVFKIFCEFYRFRLILAVIKY